MVILSLGFCPINVLGFRVAGTGTIATSSVLRASAEDSTGAAGVSRRDMFKTMGSAVTSAVGAGENHAEVLNNV